MSRSNRSKHEVLSRREEAVEEAAQIARRYLDDMATIEHDLMAVVEEAREQYETGDTGMDVIAEAYSEDIAAYADAADELREEYGPSLEEAIPMPERATRYNRGRYWHSAESLEDRMRGLHGRIDTLDDAVEKAKEGDTATYRRPVEERMDEIRGMYRQVQETCAALEASRAHVERIVEAFPENLDKEDAPGDAMHYDEEMVSELMDEFGRDHGEYGFDSRDAMRSFIRHNWVAADDTAAERGMAPA